MGRSFVTSTVIALALVAPAAAALPKAGSLSPARSLGGIRLGESPRAVRAALGTFYGTCRDCPRRTWYFTYRPFQKAGLAVEFTRGRVSGVYTLWRPAGWHAPHKLGFGTSVLISACSRGDDDGQCSATAARALAPKRSGIPHGPCAACRHPS